MRRLGIIGGIAPESTVDYYRHLVAGYRARVTDGSYPPLLINSIDLSHLIGLVSRGALDELTDFLAGEVARLERSGAELGLFAANTPHLVFDAVQARASIPLISIVEATGEAAARLGLARVGLLGTRFTMQARFYPDGFARRGIAVVAPAEGEQEALHQRYVGELVLGVFRDSTRAELLELIDRLVARERLDGVILGGTELPLLFRADSAAGVPLLDTGRIHAARAVEEMLSG